MNVTVPPDYRPTDKEPFMNSKQQEYFRRKLLNWRAELLKESEETLESLQEGGLQEPDLADRASAEMERALELRTRDRARKLIAKIDAATLDKLKTDAALLTSILTYHVVPGQAGPDQVVGTHKTVNGADLTVGGSGDHLTVNNANVVCGGITATNATIYLIDSVLLPPA